MRLDGRLVYWKRDETPLSVWWCRVHHRHRRLERQLCLVYFGDCMYLQYHLSIPSMAPRTVLVLSHHHHVSPFCFILILNFCMQFPQKHTYIISLLAIHPLQHHFQWQTGLRMSILSCFCSYIQCCAVRLNIFFIYTFTFLVCHFFFFFLFFSLHGVFRLPFRHVA